MSVTDDGAMPQSQDEYCGYCGTRIPPMGNFCPACGALKASVRADQPTQIPIPVPVGVPRIAAKRPPSWRMIIKTILAFGAVTFVVQLFLGLAALIYGTTIVLPEIVHHTYTVYVIAPVLIAVGKISGDALAAYYLLIVAAIIASAVWLFLSSSKDYLKELRMKGESRKHSAIFDLCGLMFGVLFLNVVVVIVTGIFWGDPVSPTEETDLWELLFLLANASVWEELIVRVLLIGIPLLMIDFARHSVRGGKLKYILGGGFHLGIVEVTLILISSALFGYGHYEGWGAWKVFPSAVAGVAFGYMFMRHGLASAVMLHFGFDYMSIPLEVFMDGGTVGALMLQSLAVLAWLAMGAVFFGYYIIRMIEFLNGKKYFEEPPPSPVPYPFYYGYRYVPSPSGQQWSSQTTAQSGQGPPAPRDGAAFTPAPPGFGGFFVCPTCGHTEALWKDGRFRCLRCGTVV